MTKKEIPPDAYLEELKYLTNDTPSFPAAEIKSSVDPIRFSVSYALEELIENTIEVSSREAEKIRNLKQQLIDIINKAKDENEIKRLALELLTTTFNLKTKNLEERIPYEKLYNRFISSLLESFKKLEKNTNDFKGKQVHT